MKALPNLSDSCYSLSSLRSALSNFLTVLLEAYIFTRIFYMHLIPLTRKNYFFALLMCYFWSRTQCVYAELELGFNTENLKVVEKATSLA